ncbi:hypothetical protein C3731_11085 [Brucella oryzae]|uniref:Uncharacterized protein n=2 Tax=Brucella oryzae TaxID=335286 RepID=A0A2S7IZQ3_9HYPH|nr:hypothetical protein C3731_11085 [Brucella oryzae]
MMWLSIRGLAMTDALKILIEAAKTIKQSTQDREQQRRSFAYGNTKFENDLITKAMIDDQADKLKSVLR